ncbi:cytidine deaminase-like protein [Collybia nuda]|uniref:Cytidine deaminase-like protein n=1 Tax=Collybia nuda TaxID=64659 RepID=A0A9P5YBE0_9AGAR|nr:cytidine deaminase-like protein [Collybia nuda]
MSYDDDMTFIRLAISEAEKCEPTLTAFCVGCVIAVRWPSDEHERIVLSTGFSRELPGNTHAEANALSKVRALSAAQLSSIIPTVLPSDLERILAVSDVFTTMEPCSIRTSGLPPCADALIAAKIKRCFIGVGEPDDFVACEGARKLDEAGIEVIWVKGLEDKCLQVARQGHPTI